MNTREKLDFSAIRKRIYQLNKQRTKIIFKLLHKKPMVHGLPHKVYRRCGKENCKCNRGHLHGPYPALSVNKNGCGKIVMIKKADISQVWVDAKRYQAYKRALVRIRRINKQIDELLEKVKKETTRSYP